MTTNSDHLSKAENCSMELTNDLLDFARYGELDELKLAVGQMNDVNSLLFAKGRGGNTVLHMAAGNGNIEILEYLASYGGFLSYVNEPNDEGNTPLHWAALTGQLETVEFLYANGADGKVRNKAGHTPLYNAEVSGHEKVAEFILQNTLYEDDDASSDEENAAQQSSITYDEVEEPER